MSNVNLNKIIPFGSTRSISDCYQLCIMNSLGSFIGTIFLARMILYDAKIHLSYGLVNLQYYFCCMVGFERDTFMLVENANFSILVFTSFCKCVFNQQRL